ncbi:Holliday junction branch migration DNA helicase RuvB [bacterium]|nr:Holliday junction branch migration DNA helicase RuvB [bacterium]
MSDKDLFGEKETALDRTLRPRTLREFVGQTRLKKSLAVFITAAKKRQEPLEHLLFHGPPGIGKTTLAHIIARELEVPIKITSGPAIERVGDLAAILSSLDEREILFIDEIHRLPRSVEEVLYPALEEGKIDLVLGKGPSAQVMRLDLPPFTLIGATTRYASLSSPLRDRFGIVYRLNFYTLPEIEKIIKRSAKILGVKIEEEAIKILARCSRFTPRVANRLLKRVRDFAEVEGEGKIDREITLRALRLLSIDEEGLDETDRRILQIILEKFNGGPVGLNALASALGEEQSTLEEIYEPYLLRLGFIQRTPRGRVITEKAVKHLKNNSLSLPF